MWVALRPVRAFLRIDRSRHALFVTRDRDATPERAFVQPQEETPQ
jgi:hypothetical protein